MTYEYGVQQLQELGRARGGRRHGVGEAGLQHEQWHGEGLCIKVREAEDDVGVLELLEFGGGAQ